MRYILKELVRLKEENALLKAENSILQKTLDKERLDHSWDNENRRQELMDRPGYHEMGQ